MRTLKAKGTPDFAIAYNNKLLEDTPGGFYLISL